MYRHQWRLNSYFRMWRGRLDHPDFRKKLKTAMFNAGLVLKLSVSRVTFNLLFGLNRFFAIWWRRQFMRNIRMRKLPKLKIMYIWFRKNFRMKPMIYGLTILVWPSIVRIRFDPIANLSIQFPKIRS